jgi:hypothetical protein
VKIRVRVKDLVFNPAYDMVGHKHQENQLNAELFLDVLLGRKIVRARMDHGFKERLFALNPCVAARRIILEETMPKHITVFREKNSDGHYHYVIEDKDREEWLERIKSLASVS